MKFPYWRIPVETTEAFPHRKSIEKPLIPVRLVYNGKNVDLITLLDSGADDCIFNAKLGEMVDIDVRKGKIGRYTGIGEGGIKAYFHNVIIEVGGWRHPCYIGFSYETPLSFLGQNGFFNLYRIEFDLEKRSIELKERRYAKNKV